MPAPMVTAREQLLHTLLAVAQLLVQRTHDEQQLLVRHILAGQLRSGCPEYMLPLVLDPPQLLVLEQRLLPKLHASAAPLEALGPGQPLVAPGRWDSELSAGCTS